MTYSMKGPGGEVIETTAASLEKAWSNIRFRLVHQFGLSWSVAKDYDHSDLHEVAK